MLYPNNLWEGEPPKADTFLPASYIIAFPLDTSVGLMGFPEGSGIKKKTCQSRRRWFDHWVRKTPGGGNGNPLQYSCWDNPMDRGAWWATVHEVAKSWTRPK